MLVVRPTVNHAKPVPLDCAAVRSTVPLSIMNPKLLFLCVFRSLLGAFTAASAQESPKLVPADSLVVPDGMEVA